MAENSKIEWCHHSFSPWIGCQKVSDGCNKCYAERDMDHRFHRVQWGPHGERKRTTPSYWKQPQRWAKAASENGKRPRVFCAHYADWLDNQVPTEWRADLAEIIEATPELDWLLLTKRIENYPRLAPWSQAPRNVWLGVTTENQEWYGKRWALLERIPAAAVRFISYEPALGPLTISGTQLPDWIICGGESGPGARWMDPQWARDLRDECATLGLPFFFKQMTSKRPIPADLLVRQFPVGKEL
jgi:protein gp37